MAGTAFSDVYDAFMMLVKDPNLNALYNTSVSNFETYISAWLYNAITDFKNCNQSLTNSGGSFTETLTDENIKILALLMKKYWLKKTINDLSQMNLHIQDKDFKTFAEANNLEVKRMLYAQELEEVSQMLTEYGLENIDWASWLTGTFYTP